MVEGTPGVPYLGYMAQFNVVEANMKMRYYTTPEIFLLFIIFVYGILTFVILVGGNIFV